MKIIKAIDDLAHHADGSEINATHLNEKGSWRGVEFQLDLGDDNFKMVDDFMRRLMDAGQVTAAKPRREPRPYASYGKTGNISRGGAENAKLRQWCRDNRIMAREGPERLAFMSPGIKGEQKYYNPKWLWDMYDAAMEAQRGMGGDRSDEQPADAGDRGEQG